MNFLELTNEVGRLCSIQGSISDPSSVVGIQSIIVDSVASAWESLQTYRKDWDFMLRKTYFETVPGQSHYTTAETTASQGYDDLGFYAARGLKTEANGPLREIPFWSNTLPESLGSPGPLARYSIHPSSNEIGFNEPTESEKVLFTYTKTPQILKNGTDIPEITVRWHKLIVFKALELMAVYMGNGELYQKYSMEYAQYLGELMRMSIPPKRVPLYGGIA